MITNDTKAGFRISLEDRKAKDVLTVHLTRAPGSQRFFIRMNHRAWPGPWQPVSLSRVFATLRKEGVHHAFPDPPKSS